MSLISFRSLMSVAFGAALISGGTLVHAATEHHRVAWDFDPAHRAVIGFSPDGTSQSPYVSYGFSTDENQWQRQSVDMTEVFQRGITNHFVYLEDLPADSPVYYRVCDNSGCGERFWFKTAPTDNSPFVAVAGGDTRTGWTNRRNGNRLLAKIRPLFVMHGGDFTDANNVREMNQFLTDWELSYSDDTIDGVRYKRIYPIVPTHGNHENRNYRTVCQIFGVDRDEDGRCTEYDTYGAFNVSPLLRVYTLNSEFRNSGWSSYANAMNSWLESDLATEGDSATWRISQYHRPMFPHSSRKSDVPTLFNWWADLFYDYNMSISVDSDTHITKMTYPVAPSGRSFTSTTNGGTLYVGEGSWGAPARTADRPKSWTLDLASIQQFKVITFSQEDIELRTAQFDGNPSTLSRTEREVNPTALPTGINWWRPRQVGAVAVLTKAANGKILLDGQGPGNGGGGDDNILALSATDDVFIARSYGNSNFNGEELLADGFTGTYGETQTLINFDASAVPECANITSARLKLNVTNRSRGRYRVMLSNEYWSESSVTWNRVGGDDNHGATLASFTPSSTGERSVELDINTLQTWLKGNDTGFVIASAGTSDGVDMTSKETGSAPVLELEYETNATCGSEVLSANLELTDDAFISSSSPNENYDGETEGLLSDGSDSQYGELKSVLKFDTSIIPSCASIESVDLWVNVTNTSSGAYGVYNVGKRWQEQSVTWNNINEEIGREVASFTPNNEGVMTISIADLSLVTDWLMEGNHGLAIASKGTGNGLDMSSKETGWAPALRVDYRVGESCR
ncbi:DNRLRE domain-containing protein [Marinibactrum halimedae]|uniref:DNRLRE domain-containing protein n=1 Tax=Marinibactrum halimedae TaxID=1444977 RepID=A0AA37T1B3_9GAMM|nr:DNRLRE domain-containing protein [Marinibactrum halimedae]MCD9458190.1 DNRLRE domain-containing protein [Marinibactrum halimedae]GLS25125.1 hypothetical protein GCM10007877_08390 [Marinibactrum halimedae]